MAAGSRNARALLMLRGFSFCIFLVSSAEASIGVNYVTDGSDRPTPALAVALLKKQGVTQVRIRNTDPAVLAAFQRSNIQLMVGVQPAANIGHNSSTASKWVKERLLPWVSSCNITGVSVGEEGEVSESRVQAMKLVHDALVESRLESDVKVTTPVSTDLLETKFPPSAGAFKITDNLSPLLEFLSTTGSFFMLNVYPHKEANVNLSWALFLPNAGEVDPATGCVYTNALDSLLDATYAALAKLNHSGLAIVIGETGWPSKGDPGEDDDLLSPANALTYNANLVKHVLSKVGTPGRPGGVIVTYVFELFNENNRPGPVSSRNMGLFTSEMTPAYAVDLSGSGLVLRNPYPPPAANSTSTWCVAKPGVGHNKLQAALDYACSGGAGRADCSPIQPGQPCFLPNTRAAHASYAMNSYFHKHPTQENACNFRGSATITTKNPSYKSCTYASSTHSTSAQRAPAEHLAPPSCIILLLSATIVQMFCMLLNQNWKDNV